MDKVGVRVGGRKWAIELSESYSPPSFHRDVPDPPGFSRTLSDVDEATGGRQKKEIDRSWKQQKAWEVAQTPFKNLFMMGFMMWMAGNTVHLFSIGITISALWQPVSALKSVGKAFEPFQDSHTNTLAPKFVFICLNVAGLFVGLWKLNSLGLLPTHASDWVSSLPPPPMVEFSNGGIPLS